MFKILFRRSGLFQSKNLKTSKYFKEYKLNKKFLATDDTIKITHIKQHKLKNELIEKESKYNYTTEIKDNKILNEVSSLETKQKVNKKGIQGIPNLELAPIPHFQIRDYATELFKKPANFIGSIANIPNQEEEKSYSNFIWPNKSLPEVAFLGVSNAGKSTLINSLLNTKKLAKTSKKPGHTKTLNLFEVSNRLILVDVPGYGYKSRVEWGELVENYLRRGISDKGKLKMVYLLIEAKRGFKTYDKTILELLDSLCVPYQILITKADKLNSLHWEEAFLSPQSSPLAKYLIEHSQNIQKLNILFMAPLQAKFGISQLRSHILESTQTIPSKLRQYLSQAKKFTQLPSSSFLKTPTKKQRIEHAKQISR